MSDSFTLLTPPTYVRDMTAAIDAAERRVLMIALVISDDDATAELINAIERAAQRGVQVSIGLDIYFTFRELDAKSSRWSYVRNQLRKMRLLRRRLKNAGASVRWLGQFGMTLFSRRTHIKWSVVDDTVYSFGGVNLYATGIANNDYIFRSHNAALAERLSAEHHRVMASDRAGAGYKSHAINIADGWVLVDGGKVGDSLIYRRALDLARQSTAITYVSQYCPTGALGRALKRTPQTKIYFNSWQNADDRFNRWLIRWSMFSHNMTTSYTRKQYLHAKFILFTLEDGRTVAITGSHNFVAMSGWLGTREVALETEDPKIIKQLQQFVLKHVA